jgi:hypothetical protein
MMAASISDENDPSDVWRPEMKIFARHFSLSLRNETPRNFDVELCADDVFLLCSCREAWRKFAKRLSDRTPFLWSIVSVGQLPFDMAHATLWANKRLLNITPVKYFALVLGVTKASVFAYRLFHLLQASAADHLASLEKCVSGLIRHINFPVSGKYVKASRSKAGSILVITKHTPKQNGLQACPGFYVPGWFGKSLSANMNG